MQLIKKIFNTLLVAIGIALMVVLFGFAIMMIFHTSIFGYTFVKQSDSKALLVSNIDISNLKKIDVSTSNIDVIVQYASDSAGSVTTGAVTTVVDMQGIMKSNKAKYSYVNPADEGDVNYKPVVDSDGVLKIVTSEPEGLYFVNKSYVRIVLPRGTNLQDLVVSTGSNAVDIGNEQQEPKTFAVDNLTVTANKGLFKGGLTLSSKLIVKKKLNLITNFGKIEVNCQVLGDVNIKSSAGSIFFNSDIPGNVEISGQNPYVCFGSYNNESISERVDIKGNLYIHDCTDGGNVKVAGNIDKVVTIQKSPYAEFWANDINGGFSCADGVNGIKVFGSIHGIDSTIDCEDGYLYLNDVYTKLKVVSQKNGVKVANAHNDVIITNNNSDTFVNFANDAVGKTLVVENAHGNITATNIMGNALLTATLGKVSASFKKVVGENKIVAKYGAEVIVQDGITFELTTKGTQACKPDVQLGSVNYNDWLQATDVEGYKIRTDIVNMDESSEVADKLLVQVTDNGVISAKFAG